MMNNAKTNTWLDAINWGDNGLIPAIAQDIKTAKILTLAWMNRESLALTVKENRAIYWSRSRQQIWRKGEISQHVQIVKEILLDCDKDAIVLRVEQKGGIACHTGRERCFHYQLQNYRWTVIDPVLKHDIYQ